jgi:hypothetical protein
MAAGSGLLKDRAIRGDQEGRGSIAPGIRQ